MSNRYQYEMALSEPGWFLSGVDAETKRLKFVETSESRIRQLPFLDGRDRVAVTSNEVFVPVRYALDFVEEAPSAPSGGFIVHTSFCGSTLLANLVQASTNVLVYREPNILVDLADLKARKHELASGSSRWTSLLRLVIQQLSKSWAGVPTVIKPSNWANTLLPDLAGNGLSSPYVTLSMPEEEYLLANLRGGKMRLGYSLNLLNHYLASGLAPRGDVLSVERGGYSPIGRLLRLLVILHHSQLAILDHHLSGSVRFELNKIQTVPEKVLEETGWALGLKMDPALSARAIQSTMPRHAKSVSERFEAEREKHENQKLYDQFADEFASLYDWREDWAEETA